MATARTVAAEGRLESPSSVTILVYFLLLMYHGDTRFGQSRWSHRDVIQYRDVHPRLPCFPQRQSQEYSFAAVGDYSYQSVEEENAAPDIEFHRCFAALQVAS